MGAGKRGQASASDVDAHKADSCPFNGGEAIEPTPQHSVLTLNMEARQSEDLAHFLAVLKATRPQQLEFITKSTYAALQLEDNWIDSALAEAQALLKVARDEGDVMELFRYIAKNPPSAIAIAFLVQMARAGAVSADQGSRAAKKNQPARDWVLSEWEARGAEYSWNKSSFAEAYVSMVADRYKGKGGSPLKISPEHFKKHWLPKINKGKPTS